MRPPSLARISKLLADTPLPWRAVHVGGSYNRTATCEIIACNFLYYNKSRIRELTRYQPLAYGSFTRYSIDRWDGIAINSKTISKETFLELEARTRAINRAEDIGATHAEIMTAIAFKAFSQAEIDVGIIEVAANGGASDPTNILGEESSQMLRAKPLLTVMNSMAPTEADQTLAKMVSHYAGILKEGVPVLHHETWDGVFMAEMNKQYDDRKTTLANIDNELKIEDKDNRFHWYTELSDQAYHLVDDLFYDRYLAMDATLLILQWLGRFERGKHVEVDYWHRQLVVLKANFALSFQWLPYSGVSEPLYFRPLPGMSAFTKGQELMLWLSEAVAGRELAYELERVTFFCRGAEHIWPREGRNPSIVWLVAADESSHIKDELGSCFFPEDSIITTDFGGVDEQPEVRSVSADALLRVIQTELDTHFPSARSRPVLEAALGEALEIGARKNLPVVAVGSRHLLASIRRLVRDGAFEPVHPLGKLDDDTEIGFRDDD